MLGNGGNQQRHALDRYSLVLRKKGSALDMQLGSRALPHRKPVLVE